MFPSLSLLDPAFLARATPIFTPADITGLFRWYKADSYVGSDGDSVGGGTNTLGPWVDQAGSGDDASRLIGMGPDYRTNVVGTKPVIRMTNSGPFLAFAPGALGDFTVVCACRSPVGFDSFLNYNSINGHSLWRSFLGSNELFFVAGCVDNPSSAPFSSNDFMVAVARRTGVTLYFRENKTVRATTFNCGNAWSPDQLGFSPGHQMDFGEYLLYNTAISDANLDRLYDDYLKPRWTTLP